MPDWIFKNKPTAYATLASPSGTSGTTLTLTTGHGTRLPAPGAGQISAVRIENELITYTGNSGDVLTGVTRGAGATNHVAGTEVKNVLVEEWANTVTALSTDTKAALAGTSGTPQAANPYVTDADARNSNARTPTAHSHIESDTTSLVADLAARVLSTDSRLSDARTPTAHAASHKAAGGDVLAGVVGGFAPLSSGLLVPTGYLGTGTQDATTFLRGDGTWAVPSGGGGGGATVNTGADASKGTGTSGDLYLPNNGFVVYRSTGIAQVPWGPIYPLTAPDDSGFAWINQGGASTVTTKGGIFLSGPATAPHSLRIRKQAVPATPWTKTFLVLPLLNPRATATAGHVGLVFRQSSDGKLHTFSWWPTTSATDPTFSSSKWTSATAFSAHYVSVSPRMDCPLFLQIGDDGTNRLVKFSYDGQNWETLHSIGRTDFLTGDEWGFYVSAPDTTYAIGMTILSIV